MVAEAKRLIDEGHRVFLDLKFHDIPNTVRGAAREASRLGADFLTVHATGGYAMIAAAVEGAAEAGGGTRVVAVTILTHLTASTMPPGFMSPFHLVMVAPKLLDLAESAGAHGIVCAAPDLHAIRTAHPQPFFAVTPGIRPAGGATHDQQRVTTVTEAVRLGSGMLVLGRAITGAADPAAALFAARAERDEAVAALATQGSPSA